MRRICFTRPDHKPPGSRMKLENAPAPEVLNPPVQSIQVHIEYVRNLTCSPVIVLEVQAQPPARHEDFERKLQAWTSEKILDLVGPGWLMQDLSERPSDAKTSPWARLFWMIPNVTDVWLYAHDGPRAPGRGEPVAVDVGHPLQHVFDRHRWVVNSEVPEDGHGLQASRPDFLPCRH